MAKSQKKDIISELDIVGALTAELKVQELALALKKAKAEEDVLKETLIARLEAGALVSGKYTASIGVKTGACRPKWKDEYIGHFEAEHGEDSASVEDRIRAKYPVSAETVLLLGVKS